MQTTRGGRLLLGLMRSRLRGEHPDWTRGQLAVEARSRALWSLVVQLSDEVDADAYAVQLGEDPAEPTGTWDGLDQRMAALRPVVDTLTAREVVSYLRYCDALGCRGLVDQNAVTFVSWHRQVKGSPTEPLNEEALAEVLAWTLEERGEDPGEGMAQWELPEEETLKAGFAWRVPPVVGLDETA